MSKEYVVEVKDLVKEFTLGKRKITVLRGVNFNICSGEFIILFGPSGAGKTTILNMIAGLDRLTKGSIIVRDIDLGKAKSSVLANYRLSKIGMVFQDFNLIQSMTAIENVAMPLIFNNDGLRQRTKRARILLEEMGLLERLDHKPVELSGGEQQRVAIARALVNNPWILLIDEPTGNLDSNSASEIMTIITNLNKRSKRTVILVTHNPNYLGLADRVLVIDDGKIVNEMRNN